MTQQRCLFRELMIMNSTSNIHQISFLSLVFIEKINNLKKLLYSQENLSLRFSLQVFGEIERNFCNIKRPTAYSAPV